MLLSLGWKEGLKALSKATSAIDANDALYKIKSLCSSGVKDPGDITLTSPSTHHSVFLAKLLDLYKKLGWFWRIILSDTVTFKETQFSRSIICTGYISRRANNLSCGLRKKMFAFIFFIKMKNTSKPRFCPMCVCCS